jgi:hypothetical protein
MSKPTEIVRDFLNNTSPNKIEAAADRLVSADATYISLSFDNPELKRILPWTGTSSGRQAFIDTFIGVAKYWTIEDFQVISLFGTNEEVAVFGSFTYRSKTQSHRFTSPFSIHAKVKNDQIVYFQFMEDTFASAVRSAVAANGPSRLNLMDRSSGFDLIDSRRTLRGASVPEFSSVIRHRVTADDPLCCPLLHPQHNQTSTSKRRSFKHHAPYSSYRLLRTELKVI